MPTCAIHPSQPSQFESQPLSQHAISQTNSSQHSFGGGAPIVSSSTMVDDHREKRASEDEFLDTSERQEINDDNDDADDDSQALLEDAETVDKLVKMLRMRGKSVQPDLLAIVSDWLRNLTQDDTDRQSQEKSVAIIEDFIRQSAIRNAADLMKINEERSWWLAGETLEGKKIAVLGMLATTQDKAKQGEACKLDTTKDQVPVQGEDKVQSSPSASPIKTQFVAETPESSLEGSRSLEATRKSPPQSSPTSSPQRARAGASRQSTITSSEPAAAPAVAADKQGGDLVRIDNQRGGSSAPGPAAAPVAAAPAEGAAAEGAAASPEDKRPREEEGGCAYVEVAQDDFDKKVEPHKRAAEHSYEVYNILQAKRARLSREVENAKQIEQTRRQIVKELEPLKAAQAASERDMRQAALALEAAQKRFDHCQLVNRKDTYKVLGKNAHLNAVLQDKTDSNGRLKSQTDDFNAYLSGNTSSSNA